MIEASLRLDDILKWFSLDWKQPSELIATNQWLGCWNHSVVTSFDRRGGAAPRRLRFAKSRRTAEITHGRWKGRVERVSVLVLWCVNDVFLGGRQWRMDRLAQEYEDSERDYVRLSVSIGIDEDLKMILDMDPGLIDPLPVTRPPLPDKYLSWSPVPPT